MDLIVWKEKGLSEVDDAEERYQRIRAEVEPVPFHELDAQVRAFIEEASAKLPGAVVTTSKGQGPQEISYSKLGVIVKLDDDAPDHAYEEVLGAATDLGLTTYDPELGTVMGYDDSLDFEIVDNENDGGPQAPPA
jgi:hypothetical protein